MSNVLVSENIEKILVRIFVMKKHTMKKTVSGYWIAQHHSEIFIPIMLAHQKLVIRSEMEDTNETAHGEKGDADGDASVIRDNPSEEKETNPQDFSAFLVVLTFPFLFFPFYYFVLLIIFEFHKTP